jgi:hypothetical protein
MVDCRWTSFLIVALHPRLHNGALEGSQNWRVVICTPGATGDNPFLALASELVHLLPAQAQKRPFEIATVLAKEPQRISDYAVAPTGGGAVLLFVDQLEELFTLAADQYRSPFVVLLTHVAGHSHMRVVTTLRADFLPQAMAEPALAPLLQVGNFLLAPPGPAALTDMIRKPAERAGLELQDGLADEILKDAGTDPGALPLMAFCLEELYRQIAPDHRLTVDAYNATGRLRGAISRRAATLLDELPETEGADLDAVLQQLFHALVHVDATGTATRRRAFQDELGQTAPVPAILNMLVTGRLLATGDADGRATITLAHEALLLEWPALRDWLDCNRAQLQRVQTLIAALGDADNSVRMSATEVLGRVGPMAAEAVSALITALGDADDVVRGNAAAALGQIGAAAAAAAPALIIALRRDSDKGVRGNAAWALGQIGPAAADAVPALIIALRRDTGKGVRGNAAAALGHIGPAAADAVPALSAALQRSDQNVFSRLRDRSFIKVIKATLERIRSATPALL